MSTHRAKGKAEVAKTRRSGMVRVTDILNDGAAVQEWLKRLASLPPKEQNLALRENPEVAALLAHQALAEGSALQALLAESNEDRVAAESAFLVTLKPYRDRLVREYNLQTAAELMLADMVVLSYYQYQKAAKSFFGYTAFGKSCDFQTLVKYAQAYVMRANELFLRNLEALRQMKAAPFTIKIEQAGQVNVGQKQINWAGKPGAEAAEALDAPSPR